MNVDQIIKYINTYFKNIVNNKVKAFEQSVIKNYNLEKTYELKNPVLLKHFITNAIEEFKQELALKNKEFRVDFNEDTYNYFVRSDHDYFKKQRCISNDEKILLIELCNEKYELDQVIKENTNDEKLNMIPIIDKYFNSLIHEITVR